jgi:hypothetical protein
VQLEPDDGPATITVRVKATDPYGASAISTTTVKVDNVPPAGTFDSPAPTTVGDTFTLSVRNPSDPSPADTSAGFAYAFDCGSGYGAFSPSSSAACQSGWTAGSRAVGAEIRDKDGGTTAYRGTVKVDDPFADACAYARANSSSKLVADTICVELTAAENEAQKAHPVLKDADLALAGLTIALSPRAFTPAHATELLMAIKQLA